MINELDSGRLVGDGNLTVGQILEQWATKALPDRNLQQPTLEVHRWACDVLRAEIGAKRVKTLTRDHIEAALQRRADAGLSRNSLIKLRSTLSQALGRAERRGLVVNVAAIAELPANARAPQADRTMTVSQAHAFSRRPKGPRSSRCGRPCCISESARVRRQRSRGPTSTSRTGSLTFVAVANDTRGVSTDPPQRGRRADPGRRSLNRAQPASTGTSRMCVNRPECMRRVVSAAALFAAAG
jgi:hypothetical protein